jgi:serine 3-dehydrogenase
MSVFISGASSGIGEACAHAFASAGHDLVLVARREDRLSALQHSLNEEYRVKVHCFHLDVRNRDELNSLIQQNPEVFQTIDVLINNAGLAKGRDPIQKGKPEDWEIMIDTNLKGLLNVTHGLLPGMVERKKGHIVNIGSVAGHWTYENGNVYCATKYAVRALTEGMRMDLNGTGIRVTEISPGMVETEFSEVRFGNKDLGSAVYQGRTPLTPKDIAETVLWCVQRPSHVNIQEVVIFPTEQASVHSPLKKLP